jgi:peptidoglycan hydrolase CwlO-like protein
MELIADILLVAGALGAGFYCFVLARRLKRFNDLEKGVGGAVAVLSAQVDDLNKSLMAAQKVSDGSSAALNDLTGRAESVAQRLELMMASMHDIPAAQQQPAAAPAARTTAEEHDALAAAYEAESQPQAAAEPEEEAKPSSGLMFVRHNRNQSRVA